jgi:hypothetical protein
MKKIIIKSFLLSLFLTSTLNVYSKEDIDNTMSLWVKEITNVYTNIRICANKKDSLEKYGLNNNDKFFEYFLKYDDSLSKLNTTLLFLFKNANWEDINFKELNNQINFTEFSVLNSTDSNLHFISWDTYLGGSIASYTTVLVFKIKEKFNFDIITKPIFNDNSLIGDNMYPTKVLLHKYANSKKIYFIYFENKCGNICVKKQLRVLKLNNNDVVFLKGIFKDEFGYYNNITFDFNINNRIVEEPDFKIDLKLHLVMQPIFNKQKSMQIGNKKFYFININ